jgi:hypothetical protein
MFLMPKEKSCNLLDKGIEKKYKDNSGAGSMVSGLIGLFVAIVVIVAIGIPITNAVIATANLTGMPATIVGFLPLFLGLVALVVTVGYLGGV